MKILRFIALMLSLSSCYRNAASGDDTQSTPDSETDAWAPDSDSGAWPDSAAWMDSGGSSDTEPEIPDAGMQRGIFNNWTLVAMIVDGVSMPFGPDVNCAWPVFEIEQSTPAEVNALGFACCGYYESDVTLENNRIALAVPWELFLPSIAGFICAPEARDREINFFAALTKVEVWESIGDTLTLSAEDGSYILEFTHNTEPGPCTVSESENSSTGYILSCGSSGMPPSAASFSSDHDK